MTATLPREVQDVFHRCPTTEYTTVDGRGQPITWAVTPYYSPGDECIDVSTGLRYPKKARDARANPKVALLFSEPTGGGAERSPQVLVQGTAVVDDRDLAASRERYVPESVEGSSSSEGPRPPEAIRALFSWYFARIYVHVRPERVYVWPEGDPTRAPDLYDTHIEEVRSGHDEEPPAYHAKAEGRPAVWDERLDQLRGRAGTAVLSLVAPDGFPFAVRVLISVDSAARRVRLPTQPVGAPLQPGLACLAAPDHEPGYKWRRGFQVQGDLVEDDGGWAIVPRTMISGLEPPHGALLSRFQLKAVRAVRSWRTARGELRSRR